MSIAPPKEIFTLEFNDGEFLHVPKATLSLCGELFKNIFEYDFQENQTRTIKFTSISSSAFRVILQKVEKGIVQVDKTEYNTACEILGFPYIPGIVFGKEKWEQCYSCDVGEEPPLPVGIHEILKADCPFFPGKKVGETHLLTLIPATVNDKPYDLDVASHLIQHPKEGYHATKYNWYSVQKTQKVLKSYWVLMAKDVIPESRGMPYAMQLDMALQAGYDAPGLLEATTVISMHYVSSAERLFIADPCTFTCCQHKERVVGFFSDSGLFVNFHSDGNFAVGIAPLRRFF